MGDFSMNAIVRILLEYIRYFVESKQRLIRTIENVNRF